MCNSGMLCRREFSPNSRPLVTSRLLFKLLRYRTLYALCRITFSSQNPSTTPSFLPNTVPGRQWTREHRYCPAEKETVILAPPKFARGAVDPVVSEVIFCLHLEIFVLSLSIDRSSQLYFIYASRYSLSQC